MVFCIINRNVVFANEEMWVCKNPSLGGVADVLLVKPTNCKSCIFNKNKSFSSRAVFCLVLRLRACLNSTTCFESDILGFCRRGSSVVLFFIIEQERKFIRRWCAIVFGRGRGRGRFFPYRPRPWSTLTGAGAAAVYRPRGRLAAAGRPRSFKGSIA